MDKASVSGAGDCRFESCHGRYKIFLIHISRVFLFETLPIFERSKGIIKHREGTKSKILHDVFVVEILNLVRHLLGQI